MNYEKRQADYDREYRRRKAAKRRAENPNIRPIQSVIAEYECDPWHKLAVAVCYNAALDGYSRIRSLCATYDLPQGPFAALASSKAGRVL